MAAFTDITFLSALELSEAIRLRQVSCLEVMTAYLGHIDAINPAFNAIVSRRDTDVLLKEAQEKDRELAAGQYHGWMHGFPHAVKDLADVKGMITSRGSPIFQDSVAPADSIFVERLRAAGVIFIGKTNVPEFGLGSQSYNPVFGATGSAWDPTKTAGGSSGGAACSVALRMLPVADGSDMMGSLRNPGAFNSVIGFRPSIGLVPGVPNFYQQLATAGPMGRTVPDTAKLLSTMAGHDRRAPLSRNDDPAQFEAPLDRDFTGTRIGWLGDFDGYLAMEDGVIELCESSLANFTAIGCTVENTSIDYPMPDLWQSWLALRQWTVGGNFGPLHDNPATRDLLKPEVRWEIESGKGLTLNDLQAAMADRATFYTAVHKAFETSDFLILPTAQVFPFDKETHWPSEIAGRKMDTYHRWMEVVMPATMSGGPAISVPAGFSATGLPMGIQIIGPMGHDFEVLQIAHAFEQAAGLHVQLPPVLNK